MRIHQDHLSGRVADETIARHWIDQFCSRLDPRRLYFLQADYDEFSASAPQLSDMALHGDFTFPVNVRDRYRRRVEAATSMALEFLSRDPDFSLDEEIPKRFSGRPTSPIARADECHFLAQPCTSTLNVILNHHTV